MSNKRLKLSVLFLFVLALTGIQAQTLYVKETTGAKTVYPFSNVRKMTFSLGNVTIHQSDNSMGVYALSGIRYLSFEDYTTDIKEQVKASTANIITYPNPVQNVLNVDLTGLENSRGTISILSLEGKVLQEQPTNGAVVETLDLSQLPKGIYLCRYSSSKGIKTVKIIKQ